MVIFDPMRQGKSSKGESMKLRILGENKGGHWIATCLEYNIVVEGQSFEQACHRIEDAIVDYLKVVFDTNDPLSIPQLLNRPAPLTKFWKFALAEKVHHYHRWKTNFLNPPRFSLHAQTV